MIDSKIFYARKAICTNCANWKGVCMLGHSLQNTLGCPLKKFPGIQAVGYMPIAANKTENTKIKRCCGAKNSKEIEPLAWSDVFKHLFEAVKLWKEAGYPLVSDTEYTDRITACKACKNYRWFQCQICRCIVFSKAKLKTEACPEHNWRS
jgi:hypothetical protein